MGSSKSCLPVAPPAESNCTCQALFVGGVAARQHQLPWALPGASWSLKFVPVFSSRGFSGCLYPVVILLAGVCVQSWPGRALVSGRLLDRLPGGRPRGSMPPGGRLRGGGFLRALWSFLGPPGKHPESTRKATLFVCLFVCMFVCFVCLFVSFFVVWLFIWVLSCLFVCSFVCLSVRLFI